MILVFNSGSSSLKFTLYTVAGDALREEQRGSVTRLGAHALWRIRVNEREIGGETALYDYGEAARWILSQLSGIPIEAVGHRVVHGGDIFQQATPLTPHTIAQLDQLSVLAPLHNPPALAVIQSSREIVGDGVPMVAVFDTAFHTTLPEAARAYAIPSAWVRAHGIRRYGFHGIAHRYMFERYLSLAHETALQARVVTLQLGNGCSACAIRGGQSIETSMGYTPLEGLVMATRAGDVDPGALLTLLDNGITVKSLADGLNRHSGLLALSGETGDMQQLIDLAAQGHSGAEHAIEVYCQRVRKYLGAYFAILGGATAIVFGGGVGEHAPTIRARICADMQWAGVRLDNHTNAAMVSAEGRISANGAIDVYVVSVDEEQLIARETHKTLDAAG